MATTSGERWCMSYSPDGVALATGVEDGTLKLWIASSGLCYCILSSHIAPITAVTFSSLDGPAQFVSLAIEPGGEIAVAGTVSDPFW